MKLTISLATRGRPDMLMDTVWQTVSCMSLEETRLVVMVDRDDTATETALANASLSDSRVLVSVEDRPDSIAEKWNRAVTVAPADVYLTACDDVAHVTPGFDEKILRAADVFPDGIGVIYDHMANLSFPILNAVTARWVDLVGYIYPTYFPYWFVDHWLDDLAKMVGRITTADVAVRCQPTSTTDHREPMLWASLYDALFKERREVAERIFAAPDFVCEAWRKDMLRSTRNLIDERSRMVNDQVRAMQSLDQTMDERYQRIRRNGVARVLSNIEGINELLAMAA